MKILYTSLLFLMNCVLSVAQPEIIVPKPHQLKWHEAEMGAVFHYDLLRTSTASATDKAITASPPLKIITFLIQPNSILINGYKQPKLPDANLPYSQPPTKPDSDFGKVMSIRIA